MRTEHLRTYDDFNRILEKDNTQDIVLFRGQPIDDPPLPGLARIRPDRDIRASEIRMLEEFKLQALPFLAAVPETTWEWLAIAQHHGLPTRYLDWTPNPLAALWFAVQSEPRKDSTGRERDGVLWVFKPLDRDFVTIEKSPMRIRRAMVYRPPHIATRIRAQAGYFTVHRLKKATAKFATAHDDINRSQFIKVIVPAANFALFRYRLDQYGVNKATLFPDLDGVCQHVRWLHSRLTDEKKLARNTRLEAWTLRA